MFTSAGIADRFIDLANNRTNHILANEFVPCLTVLNGGESPRSLR